VASKGGREYWSARGVSDQAAEHPGQDIERADEVGNVCGRRCGAEEVASECERGVGPVRERPAEDAESAEEVGEELAGLCCLRMKI